MSPLSSYQHKLDQQDVLFDLHQQPALYELERVYQLLVSNPSSADGVESIQGVYLWGDVGRGKTFLMDLFYDCSPDDVGLRLHFHHFMARLHRELNLAFGQKSVKRHCQAVSVRVSSAVFWMNFLSQILAMLCC